MKLIELYKQINERPIANYKSSVIINVLVDKSMHAGERQSTHSIKI